MVYLLSLGVVNRYRINQAIPSVPDTSDDPSWSSLAEDTLTSTALLPASSDTGPDVITSAQGVVLSSDIPTVSVIQITALPPATTLPQAVSPKLPHQRQVNILYLIPLFIALGVVLGSTTAIILLKWREKRSRSLRTSSLVPGPPYVPPEDDVEDRLLAQGCPSMEQVSLFAASTPSKFTVHGSRYTPKQILTWRTLDVTRPPYPQLSYTPTIISSSDGERFTVVKEEDPFLASSHPTALQQPPAPSSDLSLPPTIRVLPSLHTPQENPQVQDTNLPKPFRRSMFDILKPKHPYRRQIPRVHDGYNDPASGDEPSQVGRVSSTNESSLAGEGRFRRIQRSLDVDLSVCKTEDPLGLLDLREDQQNLADDPATRPNRSLRLKDDVLFSPTQGKSMRKPRNVTPFPVEYKGSPKEASYGEDQAINGNAGDSDTDPDIYVNSSQHRRPQSPRKRLSRSASGQFFSPDTHASVLPLSPPSLMSSPLEKSLFFTSSFSSSASLAARMNSLVAIDTSSVRHAVRSPESSLFPLPSKKKKATKKLRSSRPVPPLPYPSYPDHGHTELTSHSISADTKRRPVSLTSPDAKGGTRRESTTGISALGSLSPTSLMIALASSSSSDTLNKVNDIVAQGYIKRRMSMGGASKDPI